MNTNIKHSTSAASPEAGYLALFNQPPCTPHGSFWETFFKLKEHGPEKAKLLLRQTYLDKSGTRKDSHRIQTLQAIAGCHITRINDFGWPELLAISGCSICLHQLLAAGRVSAVHAVHAEIELGRHSIPNPHLRASDTEMNHLLLLYDIEQEMLCQSAHNNSKLEQWLRRRRERALSYFEEF